MNEKWKERAKALEEISDVAMNVFACALVFAVAVGVSGAVIFGLIAMARATL